MPSGHLHASDRQSNTFLTQYDDNYIDMPTKALMLFNKSFLIFKINFYFLFQAVIKHEVRNNGMVHIMDLVESRWGGMWKSKD
jgi:hypothetical protein